MRSLLSLALGAVLTLGASLSAQTFSVTQYGPSCGPVATGYVLPQGQGTNRFYYTMSGADPAGIALTIVGVNETAVPINLGASCLLLTELAFTQTHQIDAAGTYTWSHSLSASFCGYARIQFAEVTFDAQNNIVIRTTNGLFMNCQ